MVQPSSVVEEDMVNQGLQEASWMSEKMAERPQRHTAAVGEKAQVSEKTKNCY